MESISVGYKSLTSELDLEGPAFHKFLVYTNSVGNQFYIRGGPQLNETESNAFPNSDWGGEEWDGFFNPDRGTYWGTIITEYGDYDPGTADHPGDGNDPFPTEEIVTGADLSAIWGSMEVVADQIEEAQLTYQLLSQNSNSVVDTVLLELGLGAPELDTLAPSATGENTFWAPASDVNLIEVAAQELSVSRQQMLQRLNATLDDVDSRIRQEHGAPFCFTAGTPVQLADGTSRSIEQISAGDKVLAFDGSGELHPASVARIFTNNVAEVIELFNGTQVTPGHRFLTQHGDYRAIKDMIAAGEPVVMADGSLQQVHIERRINAADAAPAFDGNLALKPVSAGIPVYNFEVEGFHNYIAGGMRVHNDCIGPGDKVVGHFRNPDGTETFAALNLDTGVYTEVTQQNLSDATIHVHTKELFTDSGVKVETNQAFDPVTGEAVGDREVDLQLSRKQVTSVQDIGEVFGSALGSAIAGDNAFAQIAAGSALAAVVGSIGAGMEFYFRKPVSQFALAA